MARRALTTLLTNRFITRSRNRSAWDALLTFESEIRERLADMYLLLVIDKDSRSPSNGRTRRRRAELLRRDKPLPRDASLLLIHLRKEHTYTDATDDPVMITRAQVVEFLRPFREEGDGDEARFDRRVDAAIRAVAELKLLTPGPGRRLPVHRLARRRAPDRRRRDDRAWSATSSRRPTAR